MPSADARKSLTQKLQQHQANLDGAASYLEARGISLDTAERFQLGYDPAKHRLVIPYLTPAGPWHLKYRCVEQHKCDEHGHQKYIYDPGVEHHLFNAQTLLDADRAILTEGELDAITAEQAGIPAVAYPGTQSWGRNKAWRWCFDSCQEVVVVADGDEPGRKAAQVVSESLRAAIGGDVTVVVLDDGHDANSFIGEFGVGAFLEEIGWL